MSNCPHYGTCHWARFTPSITCSTGIQLHAPHTTKSVAPRVWKPFRAISSLRVSNQHSCWEINVTGKSMVKNVLFISWHWMIKATVVTWKQSWSDFSWRITCSLMGSENSAPFWRSMKRFQNLQSKSTSCNQGGLSQLLKSSRQEIKCSIELWSIRLCRSLEIAGFKVMQCFFRFVRGGPVGVLTCSCWAVAYLVRQRDKTEFADSLNKAELLLLLLLSCSRYVVGGSTGVYGKSFVMSISSLHVRT